METTNYRFGPQSVEEDSVSEHSRSSSCHWQQSLYQTNSGTGLNESECGSAQVSVRDMIRRYNTAIKNNTKVDTLHEAGVEDKTSHRSNISLADDMSCKSVSKTASQQLNPVSYMNSSCSSNNTLHKMNPIAPNTQLESGLNSAATQAIYCRNCASCILYPEKSDGANVSDGLYESNKMRGNFYNSNNNNNNNNNNNSGNNKCLNNAENNTFNNTATIFSNCAPKCRQGDYDKMSFTGNKGSLYSTGRMQPTKEIPPYPEPKENSYHSKTTIVKTTNGIRIIIDIYFDNEECVMRPIDVVGNRIETEIPKSHILDHFQTQSIIH